MQPHHLASLLDRRLTRRLRAARAADRRDRAAEAADRLLVHAAAIGSHPLACAAALALSASTRQARIALALRGAA